MTDFVYLKDARLLGGRYVPGLIRYLLAEDHERAERIG